MKKLAALLLVSTPAFADGWTTATHFGYAIHQDAVTEFENAGGTVLFLDVGRSVHPDVEVGLRTGAQGAEQGGREYYRLGAGPVVAWSFADGWGAHAAVMKFRESGLEDGDSLYRSQGTVVQLGWQRRVTVGTTAEVAWGGYVARHSGRLAEAAGPSAAASRFAAATGGSVHEGLDRGLTVALRLKL